MTTEPSKRRLIKRSKPSRAAPPVDVPTPLPLALRGDFANQIKIIPSTMMNLRIAIGEMEDERSVLVPFIELAMSESNPEGDEEPQAFFKGILTMENAAYLIADMANDFLLACQHLSAVADSSIKPDKTRTSITETFVEMARTKLEECSVALKKAGAKSEPA